MTKTKKTGKLRVIAAVLYVLLALYSLPNVLSYHINWKEVPLILSLQFDAIISSTYYGIANLSTFIGRVLIAAGLIWGRRDRLGRILILAGTASSLLYATLNLAQNIVLGFPFESILLLFVTAAATPILVLIIATASMRNQTASYAKGFWCVLLIWGAIATVWECWNLFELYSKNLFTLTYYLCAVAVDFLYLSALLCATTWMAFPDGFSSSRSRNSAHVEDTPESEGYFGLVSHVLLLLCTFGIWQLIWIYRTTKFTNLVSDELPRNPAAKLLLCMFIPFYPLYWTYKTAQRIDKLARAKGIPSDLSVVCLILAIFIGFIPPILMQSKINTIATTVPVQSSPRQSSYGTVDELKQYKELLDSGVITQEEFDAKKKQLLGL